MPRRMVGRDRQAGRWHAAESVRVMARYMLDTDTVSYALRGYGNAGRHMLELSPSDVCMSALTLSELRYGADLKGSRKLHRLIDAFAGGVDAVPFDATSAAHYGRVAAALDKK